VKGRVHAVEKITHLMC